MNVKIDLKSMLLGLAIGIIGFLALGASSPSSQVGRYRVSGSIPYFLVVDSVTGKVWAGNFQTGQKNTDADFFSRKTDE